MPNLPPVLPRAPGGPAPALPMRPTSGIGRAQQFSVSKLQQHVDREKATTSIAGAISRNQGAQQQPTTSINRVGDEQQATTSINHVGEEAQHSIYQQDETSGVRDRLRYQYIRKMIRERKATEAAVAKMEASQGGIDVKTGGSLRMSGVSGFTRTMKKLFRSDRSAYKNIAADKKAMIQQIIQNTAKNKPTGANFTFSERKKMGQEVYKQFKTGAISKEEYHHFKDIISKIQ